MDDSTPGKGDVGETVPDPREELAKHEEEAQARAVPHKRRHERQRDKGKHHQRRDPAILLRGSGLAIALCQQRCAGYSP